MSGFWLYADFSAQLGRFGGDLETVESPNGPYDRRTGQRYKAGFETGAGLGGSLSADASFSCAVSLKELGFGATSPLVAQIKQLVPKTGGSPPAGYQARIERLASSLQQSFPNIWQVALTVAHDCKP
jgi:hypothetical protein